MKNKQKKNKKKTQKEINRENIEKGIHLLTKHLLFYFYNAPHIVFSDEKKLGRKANVIKLRLKQV